MKLLSKICLAIAFTTIICNKVFACSACNIAGINQGFTGPIITMNADTMQKNRFAIGLGINYTSTDPYDLSPLASSSSHSHRKFHTAAEGKDTHAHSIDDSLYLNLNASYGLTDRLTLMANLPYNFIWNINALELGELEHKGNSIGIGDLQLLAKYKLIDNETYKLRAALIGGIKMPTGLRSVESNHGHSLSVDHQPGTGSWDPIMGFAISKQIGDNWSFDASTLYKLSTKGTDDVIVGDLLNYNFAISHKLPWLDGRKFDWDASFEINTTWREKVEINGIKDEAHGGTIVSLSPGIRLIYDDKWINTLAFSFPVSESLNGHQSSPDFSVIYNFIRLF